MKTILVSQIVGTHPETGTALTLPTGFNADSIRNFFPRHNSAPGTRITFDDGGGWAVTETYAEVKAMVAAAGVKTADLNMVKDVEAIIDEESGEVINGGDEASEPTTVRTDAIRSFNPRKHGKTGTRLTFERGKGIAVSELFEAVTAAVA